MNKDKKFFKKHEKIFIDLISVLIILSAFVALLSYYFNIYTKQVDIGIIIIVLLLGLDCFFYDFRVKKYNKDYMYLGILFTIVAIAHLSRFILGPIHCQLFPKIISVYLYELLALTTGFLLFYFSLFLIKKKSGARYHHIAGILVGLAMTINHLFKIVIGKCV